MPTTTDFQVWLDNLEDDDTSNIYDLYESINGENQMGAFESKTNDKGQIFISSDLNDHTLMLASEDAKRTFLDILDKAYGGDFGWVGGQYEFERSMNKDD